MFDIEKEREAFEEALAGNKIHNLRVCTMFDSEKNEYFASDVCDPSEDHIVDSINLSWRMWQASALRAEEKLEGCVVVPKDQIETWWQDAEEPENFASTIESIPALGENLGGSEIMEIDEHHTIHLPSKRIYGTWFEKDGERSFVTGSLEECRAMVEAARGGK